MIRLPAVRLVLSALAIGLGLGTVLPGALAASLTLYSAQHEQTVDLLTKAFTKETGIDVKVHSGEAPELASQLVKEGASSPADVFFTENSPGTRVLVGKGTAGESRSGDAGQSARPIQRVRRRLGRRSGARKRPRVQPEHDPRGRRCLPRSLDLAKPEWKGKIAIAPTDADFLPLVGAVVALKGRPAALEWLKGLHDNATIFDDDEGVVAAVDRGAARDWDHQQLLLGATPHGKRRRQDAKRHSPLCRRRRRRINERLRGCRLKSSRNQAAAQKFLAFLVSKPAQEMMSKLDITFEYPLVAGVAANPILKPMSELQPPSLTLKQLGDDRDAGHTSERSRPHLMSQIVDA